jgi:hypothetical protein
MATKKRTSKHVRLVDLKPGEANVLSFVAQYAGKPAATEEELVEVLAASTRRARGIGNVILGKSLKAKPIYRVMAGRFLDASKMNLRNAERLICGVPIVRDNQIVLSKGSDLRKGIVVTTTHLADAVSSEPARTSKRRRAGK